MFIRHRTGPGSGLYRSRDGGEHWKRSPATDCRPKKSVAWESPSRPAIRERIYLIVDAKAGGLYRSDDSGENWQLMSQRQADMAARLVFRRSDCRPRRSRHRLCAQHHVVSLARRRQDISRPSRARRAATIITSCGSIPMSRGRMIMGVDQGTIITRNGGETWSSWYNQPTGQFYHVITDDRFPYWVYGAQQDSGSAATPSRGKYRALNSHDWRPIGAGDENGYIAPDPENPDVIYGGFVERQDLDSEQTQPLPPTLAHPGDYRRTWTLPLVFSPLEKNVLYFSSQVLFRTADGGGSWQVISPDLTREDPDAPPNLDPPTIADAGNEKRRGVIYSLGPSYIQKGEIWAGTDDGLIQLTLDEGKTWNNRDKHSTELYVRDALGSPTASRPGWACATRASRGTASPPTTPSARASRTRSPPPMARRQLRIRTESTGLCQLGARRRIERRGQSPAVHQCRRSLHDEEPADRDRPEGKQRGRRMEPRRVRHPARAHQRLRPLRPRQLLHARLDGTAHHRGVEASAAWRHGAWSCAAARNGCTHARRQRDARKSTASSRPTCPRARSRCRPATTSPACPAWPAGDSQHESGAWCCPTTARDPGLARARRRRCATTTKLGRRRHWTWRAGVDNLFDQRAWRESPYQFGHVYLFPLAPRTLRVSLQADL